MASLAWCISCRRCLSVSVHQANWKHTFCPILVPFRQLFAVLPSQIKEFVPSKLFRTVVFQKWRVFLQMRLQNFKLFKEPLWWIVHAFCSMTWLSVEQKCKRSKSKQSKAWFWAKELLSPVWTGIWNELAQQCQMLGSGEQERGWPAGVLGGGAPVKDNDGRNRGKGISTLKADG